MDTHQMLKKKKTNNNYENQNYDFCYNEWDHATQKYRKDWCKLNEITIEGIDNNFIQETLNKHRGLLKNLNRTFEALRQDEKKLKKQNYGDDIDLDAFIDAYIDLKQGKEIDEKLFTKLNKVERNVAVMFMIDMSGSTSGWINKMEKESLVLLCQSLEILGDTYGIYGFSGKTRNHCEIYKIKDFNEKYDKSVKDRICNIQAMDYTRMGASIRHLTMLLNNVEAKTKLLITLSDGKPDDVDGYRGTYGIEDTKKALIEARFQGIHTYCITIDEEAMDYLPYMYGKSNFAVINQVNKLPLKVSDIYKNYNIIMNKILIILSIFILTSCKNNVFTNIAKTDVDIITEIHVSNANNYIEDLIIKLYKINPKYILKNKEFDTVSSVIIDIFKEVDKSKLDRTGQENINLILKGFSKDFNGDRIYLICKGLYGMINASYNYKRKFYLTDPKLDAQKIMNTAINIETLVWRLSNEKENNILLIKTNSIDDNKNINLSFERLFGKLINNQENMAKIISSQQGRIIQKATKGIVSSIFLPIGF